MIGSSVAMCTYNGARFLPEQLASLLSQEQLPSQVVICDDQSQDGTAALLEEFAVAAGARGIRVELHFNARNLGFVKNFEKALSLCDGDVVFLCDQDDVWQPRKLAVYMALFESDPLLQVVHSDARLVDAEGNSLGHGLFEALAVTADERRQMNADGPFDVLIRRNIVTGATMAFRRELADVAMPVEAGWIHDEWLAMVAATRRGHFRCLDWQSTDYRQHEGNQIGASKRSAWSRLHRAEGARSRYIAQVVHRLDGLVSRSSAASWINDGQMDTLRRRVAHGRVRAALKPGLLRNWRQVLGQMRDRSYWRYSDGWRSIIVDLLGRP